MEVNTLKEKIINFLKGVFYGYDYANATLINNEIYNSSSDN